MRNTRFALIAGILCGMGATVMAAAPATPPATAPATATASAPATGKSETQMAQESAARKALGDFFHAMFAGDQKTAFDFLAFTDAAKRPVAEKMFGEILAEQRLRKAVTDAFGADKTKVFDLGLGDDEQKDFEKELGGATIKVTADSATIQMGAGPTFVVVSKGDKWLVDFDQTQKNMGPLPQDAELDALSRKIAGYDQLTKDVAAKKYDSVDAVSKKVDDIDAASEAKGPESQPATAPAPK